AALPGLPSPARPELSTGTRAALPPQVKIVTYLTTIHRFEQWSDHGSKGARLEKPRRGTSGVSERAIWGFGGLTMIALPRSTARDGRRFLVARAITPSPPERPRSLAAAFQFLEGGGATELILDLVDPTRIGGPSHQLLARRRRDEGTDRR